MRVVEKKIIDHVRPGGQGQNETHVSLKQTNKKATKDHDFIGKCVFSIRRKYRLNQDTIHHLLPWENITYYGGNNRLHFYNVSTKPLCQGNVRMKTL